MYTDVNHHKITGNHSVVGAMFGINWLSLYKGQGILTSSKDSHRSINFTAKAHLVSYCRYGITLEHFNSLLRQN